MMQLPEGIPMWTHDIEQLIEPLLGFDKPQQQSGEHNALADARYSAVVLNAAMEFMVEHAA